MTPDIEEEPTHLGCTLTGEVMKAHWEDSWGEVPTWPRDEWRGEVSQEATQLGYWEWAQAQQEDQTHEYSQLPILI